VNTSRVTVIFEGNSFSILQVSDFEIQPGPSSIINLTIYSSISGIHPNGTIFIKIGSHDGEIPLLISSGETRLDIVMKGFEPSKPLVLYAVVTSTCCFTWISEKKVIVPLKGTSQKIEIQLIPLTVLIEMMDLHPVRPEQTATPLEIEKFQNHNSWTTAETYGIAKTVTATQIKYITGESKCSRGAISHSFFDKKIDELLKLLSFKNRPFFSVIDINLSHQMSYFLSVLAFYSFGKHRNKLIINFDSHDDFRNSAEISFDGWGSGFFSGHLQRSLSFPKNNRITYMTLGNAEPVCKVLPPAGIAKQRYYKSIDSDELTISYIPDDTVYMFTKRRSADDLWSLKCNTHCIPMISNALLETLICQNSIECVSEMNRNQRLYKIKHRFFDTISANDLHLDDESCNVFRREFDQLWHLKRWNSCTGSDFLDEKSIGNLSDTDVYISVDRDCMKRSCTYWGDGLFNSSQIHSAVGTILKLLKLKKANLVGFDIAGLPEKNIQTAFPNGNTDEYIEQAKEDIRIFRELVFKYF
jgi:hypothetical protein